MSILGGIQTSYWGFRDYLAPVLRNSKFKETGRITPDEFVAAGDFLSYKFPVWSWKAADADTKARDFLPSDKQYLISRGVPCLRRAHDLAVTQIEREIQMSDAVASGKNDHVAATDASDIWIDTMITQPEHDSSKDSQASSKSPEILSASGSQDYQSSPSMPQDRSAASHMKTFDMQGLQNQLMAAGPSDATNSLSPTFETADHIPHIPEADIPEIEDEDEHGFSAMHEPFDPSAAQPEQPSSAVHQESGIHPKAKTVASRTYDCLITYDKFYQVPRLWLIGYDENGAPLSAAAIFEDISAEHASKTVTVEPFPHSSTLTTASVHPCKHADVMHKFIKRMDADIISQSKAAKGEEPSASTAKPEHKKSSWLGRVASSGVRSKAKSSTDQEASDPEDEGLRVDQYLLIFLKFISTIAPTIEIDATSGL